MNTEDMLTLIISSQKIYGLYGLKHHIVEMRRGVTDAGQRTNEQTLKIELLSQCKLEAEFRVYSLESMKRYDGLTSVDLS